jgi:ornithine cyclodeaminase
MLLYLSESDVESLLTLAMAEKAIREALCNHADGKYQQPLKPYVRPLGRGREMEGGRFIAMPAYLGRPFHIAGIKWISGFPANVDKGVDRASGMIILNSADTGQPEAIMQCATISARRTAAVARITIDLLEPKGQYRVTVAGAGPIARALLEALLDASDSGIESVTIYDLRFERAQRLAAYASRLSSIPVRAVDDARDAVTGAAVLVTATTAHSAYIRRDWLAGCRLVVALSFEDCGEEMLLNADKVVVDDFDQCNREEKLLHRLVRDGRFSRDRVYAELGQIVSGIRPGREHPEELIYVNPMGMAIEDIAVAAEVHRAARLAGRGLNLQPNVVEAHLC